MLIHELILAKAHCKNILFGRTLIAPQPHFRIEIMRNHLQNPSNSWPHGQDRSRQRSFHSEQAPRSFDHRHGLRSFHFQLHSNPKSLHVQRNAQRLFFKQFPQQSFALFQRTEESCNLVGPVLFHHGSQGLWSSFRSWGGARDSWGSSEVRE